jgi:hypothetical protein
MLVVVSILFAVPVFMFFNMYTLIPKNNSSSENDFSKNFTRLDKEFTEIYKSNKKPVVVINVEIIGYINGNGNLLIIHQPYKKIENIDWYNPEYLINYTRQ